MSNGEDIQIILTVGLIKIVKQNIYKITQFINSNTTVFSNFKYKIDIIYKFQ